ncbi:MAG TPA: putative zinc-binding peptidase [Acidocella sp.]|nr:putative zinc-binding peptidase [Acidocella sp.]
MRLFTCEFCGQTLFFENSVCGRCGHELGFSSDQMTLLTLEREGEVLRPLGGGTSYAYCQNAKHGVCNWLVPVPFESPEGLCAACRHNQTIPDLSIGENLKNWRSLEAAKHRLFYTLLRLNLPLRNVTEDPEQGLAFEFMADSSEFGPRILTGHDEGLITINLAEANDAMRERFRDEMAEPYRTLLGHFRHEIGHYYWNELIRNGGRLEACRAVFGDESRDYGAALKLHYEQGPPSGWEEYYISAYATMHPWEDFAESWAHYLHIVDTLETASAFGLRIHPRRTDDGLLHSDINFDAYKAAGIGQLIDAWLPLTFAMNAINRSMGHADMYPFVVSQPVVNKLGFIHDLVHGRVAAQAGAEHAAPTLQALRFRNASSRTWTR